MLTLHIEAATVEELQIKGLEALGYGVKTIAASTFPKFTTSAGEITDNDPLSLNEVETPKSKGGRPRKSSKVESPSVGTSDQGSMGDSTLAASQGTPGAGGESNGVGGQAVDAVAASPAAESPQAAKGSGVGAPATDPFALPAAAYAPPGGTPQPTLEDVKVALKMLADASGTAAGVMQILAEHGLSGAEQKPAFLKSEQYASVLKAADFVMGLL